MNAWQNGCFRKMDDHLVHATPNNRPPKLDNLPKTFLQIILAAKQLVRHSSTSPKQQRGPLPTPLSVSSSTLCCYSTVRSSHPYHGSQVDKLYMVFDEHLPPFWNFWSGGTATQMAFPNQLSQKYAYLTCTVQCMYTVYKKKE